MPRQKTQFGIMFSSREMICLKINIVLDMSSSNYTVLYIFKSRDDYLLFLTFLNFFWGGKASESHFPQIICSHSKLKKQRNHSMNVTVVGYVRNAYIQKLYIAAPFPKPIWG